jgi:YHS domain-containing protein
MQIFKTLITGAALSVALATSSIAAGVELNASSTGLAMQGYDPVAYFTQGEPTKGDYRISSVYNDATYRFANEEHKAAFEADPEAYLPQYGGYCAFGAAMGFKFDGDPEYWKIVDGELFLNLSKDIQVRWEEDIPGLVERADTNWTNIADKAPSELQ